MAVKAEHRQRVAVLALKRVSVALEYALRRPSVDKQGRLSFQAPPARSAGRAVAGGGGDPISRIGPYLCPKASRNLWDLQDLVKIAALLKKLARDLRG